MTVETAICCAHVAQLFLYLGSILADPAQPLKSARITNVKIYKKGLIMRPTPDKMSAFIAQLRKKMNLKSLVVTLAAIVVFTTTYLLILPAFTLDKEEAAEQGGIDVAVEQTVDEEAPAEKAEEPAAEQKESAEVVKEAEEPAAKEEVKEETASPKQKDNDAKDEKKDSNVKEEKEEVKLLSKKKELTAEKEKKDDFTISAVVDKDAKVPEDVFLQAAELTKDTEGFDYDKYYKDALKVLKKDADNVKGIKTIKFYDISLEAESQEESVEPKAAVNVKIAYDDGLKVKDADNIRIVHFAEQKNGEVKAEVLDSKENKVETTVNKKSEMTEASFDTEGFSVFAVAETDELAGGIVTADGSAYEVTVKYGADAGVPDGATLEVSELTKDSEEYQKYMEQTAEAVGTAVEDLDYLKLLDISIMDGDEKVEIQAPVDVQIKLLDKKDKNAGEKTSVVHFGKDETAVIEPDVEGKTVNFETTGFSYYAVTSYGATTNLAGKSYAIVQVYTQATQSMEDGNNTIHAGRALATNVPQNGRLGGTTVNVELHESGYNLVTNGNTQVVEWKFESAGGANTYNIQAPNGQYLNLNNGVLELSNTPQALTVTAGTGNNAGKVRISNGNSRVTSSRSSDNNSAGNNQNFYNSNSDDGNYVYLTLCEIEEFNLDADVYQGEKVSVQDLVDGNEYIIFKTIYNNATGKYEDWVIDGNGDPVRAYDQGDSVSLHSVVSPMWKLAILTDSTGQETGYYLFVNTETGKVLHPTSGTLVKDFDPATSPTRDGVTLDGRKNGEYTSPIEYWDSSAMAYYGYQFNSDDTVTLSSVREENVQALSFAEKLPSQTGLHTVDTVDSTAAGITIHMFDYPNRDTISNVTGSNGYAVGVLQPQHVKATLSESGYPQFTNNRDGSTLFDPSNAYHQGTGNHLFLESVYDSTGYYEYSAFNNFAHWNNNGNFTVYEETGTPSTSGSQFYYHRGNFFPFNSLNTNNNARNIFTGDGSLIDYQNPNYGSDLYGFGEGNNFYFGMTMNFNFLMPKDGYEKGSPLIYEFNGDDDLWIYIDDVLILDIGGVHDAFPGTINFATGEITGGNGGAGKARTIKDCFKNAGVFPDGTPWDDSKVDEYFNGNTFVSYGSHEFNMFYMEHGAGASNLKMRFNLPVIEKGKVIVEKKLSDKVQVAYADVEYAYQIYAKDEHGKYYLVDPANPQAVYEGTTNPVKTAASAVIDGKTYEKVFYLRPNEAAVFSDLIEDENYYVREIGIDSDLYPHVYVNDVEVSDAGDEQEDGVYTSSESTPRRRARLTYTNEPVVEELHLTKKLAAGSVDNGDTFEFRVLLENTSNQLTAYYQGTYYIHDENEVYYKYEDGELVSNGTTPYPCTAGNYGTIAHIPPNYIVEIPGLMPGTDFYVDEIRVRPNGGSHDGSDDKLIGDSDWEQVSRVVTDSDEGEIKNASIYDYATGSTITVDSLGSVALNTDATVTITNKKRAVPVQLKKIDAKNEATTLDNVTFDLYADEAHTQKLKSVTTANGGYADLGELVTGTYYLKETSTLDGYDLLANDVQIIVDGSGAVTYIQKEYSAGATQTAEKENDKYTVIVRNYTGEELPMTGGIGTTIFYILGSILAVGCGIVLIARRRAGISR